MVICKETYYTVAVDIYSYKLQISPDYNITGQRARPLKPSDKNLPRVGTLDQRPNNQYNVTLQLKPTAAFKSRATQEVFIVFVQSKRQNTLCTVLVFPDTFYLS